jgi:hypothetical protein
MRRQRDCRRDRGRLQGAILFKCKKYEVFGTVISGGATRCKQRVTRHPLGPLKMQLRCTPRVTRYGEPVTIASAEA